MSSLFDLTGGKDTAYNPWEPARQPLLDIISMVNDGMSEDWTPYQIDGQNASDYFTDLGSSIAPYLEQSGELFSGFASDGGLDMDLVTTLADNPYMTGMIDAVGRDVVRNFSEVSLPGISDQAVAAGHTGDSSRLGAYEAITQRGAEDRFADISATMRGNAYQNAILSALNARKNELGAAGSLADIGSTGVDILNLGNEYHRNEEALPMLQAAMANDIILPIASAFPQIEEEWHEDANVGAELLQFLLEGGLGDGDGSGLGDLIGDGLGGLGDLIGDGLGGVTDLITDGIGGVLDILTGGGGGGAGPSNPAPPTTPADPGANTDLPGYPGIPTTSGGDATDDGSSILDVLFPGLDLGGILPGQSGGDMTPTGDVIPPGGTVETAPTVDPEPGSMSESDARTVGTNAGLTGKALEDFIKANSTPGNPDPSATAGGSSPGATGGSQDGETYAELWGTEYPVSEGSEAESAAHEIAQGIWVDNQGNEDAALFADAAVDTYIGQYQNAVANGATPDVAMVIAEYETLKTIESMGGEVDWNMAGLRTREYRDLVENQQNGQIQVGADSTDPTPTGGGDITSTLDRTDADLDTSMSQAWDNDFFNQGQTDPAAISWGTDEIIPPDVLNMVDQFVNQLDIAGLSPDEIADIVVDGDFTLPVNEDETIDDYSYPPLDEDGAFDMDPIKDDSLPLPVIDGPGFDPALPGDDNSFVIPAGVDVVHMDTATRIEYIKNTVEEMRADPQITNDEIADWIKEQAALLAAMEGGGGGAWENSAGEGNVGSFISGVGGGGMFGSGFTNGRQGRVYIEELEGQ